MERVYYTAFFLVRQVLLRKYHAAFTQIAQYFRVELQNCCETISTLFSKLSQNHLQSNAKKGILKEKRKNGQKGEVEHMKEKETTNAMSCPTKSPEASARRKMILSGVIFLVLVVAITILMIPVMRLMMQEGGKEQLIAKMPLLAVYAYQAYRHYKLDGTLMIKNPKKGYSTAENILYMLRDDGQFSELEAKVLDICLVLHAEHGGGNNSTFTTHVVTSSGTDTYSAISASIASLKGPKHGGANLKVQKMFADIEANCKDWEDREEVCAYLNKILDKEAFDKAGLIYGMGHAVYTNSDPREVILKRFAKRLSEEKGMQREFALYELVEKEAGELIMHKRKLFKPVCANVDFYSGFVYSMLGIPEELFTPIFAIARISGWCAHRLEELVNAGKIIRPAYKYVGHHRPYCTMQDRNEGKQPR